VRFEQLLELCDEPTDREQSDAIVEVDHQVDVGGIRVIASRKRTQEVASRYQF